MQFVKGIVFTYLSLVSAATACSQAPTPEGGKQHIGIERAFPQLRFHRPVYLTGAADGSDRIFVVEQDGVIRSFVPGNEDSQQVSSTNVFLDIRDLISRRGNEQGLIGLAFHPNFEGNGEFYVHYSQATDPSDRKAVAPNILSRFKVSPSNPTVADRNSEEILMNIPQPYGNHNGGMIAFGPDGFLYISLGDGGYANDPKANGQNLGTLLGSILRIDVDHQDEGLAYAVPSDNPFTDQENAKPEIWAFGLRNVWRFSFDRKTGQLFAADVGQNKWEEVNEIVKGGNYGWKRFEASNDFDSEAEFIEEFPHQKPIAEYSREWGISITGGHVYRGEKHPELQGRYFYGDYASGNLWSYQNINGKSKNELVRRTGRSIASFGEDDDGEIYLLSFDGGIYRIVPTAEPENTFDDWPALLSETSIFASMKERKVSDGLFAYEVNAPFWSDNATKTRFVQLPDGKKMTYKSDGTWQVPIGTTIVKNFVGKQGNSLRPLETRLIKRTPEGWEAATYVWRARQAEADLVPQGNQFELWTRQGVKSWHAPSSSECASCHTDAAGFVLGLRTAQLNMDIDGQNQIKSFAKKGLLDLPESFDKNRANRFANPYDETATLNDRARAYLDVNCAMCHQPGGSGNANIDLRSETELTHAQMINQVPMQGNLGIEDSRILVPGDATQSTLYHRIHTLGDGRMPTIGSNVVDEKAAALIRDWINAMDD